MLDDHEMDLINRFRLNDVDMNHPGLKSTMPLVSAHGEELRCIGSSFLVSPGLAITAAHVVDEWEDYQEQKYPGVKFSVTAYQFFNGQILPWVVDGIHSLGTADIAFLRLARPAWWGNGPDQIITFCVRLSVNPPILGTEVRLFGFPESFVDENKILNVSPSECIARARDVALQSCRSIRPTSYVELDGEILGGMSGGPCFDSDWNVIGMCSKGWNFIEDEPDSTPISYMALLWPVMSMSIDLFKTGPFPAWDLFKEGSLQAVGAHRVHVTSTGESQIGVIDPKDIKPITFPEKAEHLEGVLNFTAENALKALIEIKVALKLEGADRDSNIDNILFRNLRIFFWELNSALEIALRLAARKVGFSLPFDFEWEEFVNLWRTHGANQTALDALGTLRFTWNGIKLIEIRLYSRKSTQGTLSVESLTTNGQVIACMLEPCRMGGQQVSVPDGLEPYFDATRRFSQSILRLAWQQNESP